MGEVINLRKVVFLNEPAVEILRNQLEIEDLRLHVLRHNFGSVSASLNMSLPMIAKMLGHTQTVTTERYAHLADNPVQAAAEEVGRALSEKMKNSTK